MTSVLDLWRSLDPEARLASGAHAQLSRPIRGVTRTRAAPPHLPDTADGQLLVVDAAIIADGTLDGLLAALRDAGLAPAALWIAEAGAPLERADDAMPIISGTSNASTVVTARPSAWIANVRHARTVSPSRRTVQAPQTPCSQPTCVPVSDRSSRMKSESSRRGSTSASCSVPFTVTLIWTLRTAAARPVTSWPVAPCPRASLPMESLSIASRPVPP